MLASSYNQIKNLYRLLGGFLILTPLLLEQSLAFAQDTSAHATQVKRVVEPIPQSSSVTPSFYKVSPDKTPSGFVVPRYVSLKVGRANGRIGPSTDHPVAWQYRRRGLPLIVVAETARWRKVRDINGDESWIYAPALSGERRAIALSDTLLYSRDRDTASIRALAREGALVKIEECRSTGWCKFKGTDGLKGWAPQTTFWGASPLY